MGSSSEKRIISLYQPKGRSSGSGSNHVAAIAGSSSSSMNRSGARVCKGKAVMYASEVEWLSDRLRTLEEESEALKLAFVETMEERNELMKEICQKFQAIHDFLHFRKQERGMSFNGILTVNPPKDGRGGIGLSDVLNQRQSNPSLVIRHLRATMVEFEEPGAEMFRVLE